MIFISGVISINNHPKNTLCTNKILVVYFFPNRVNFLSENAHSCPIIKIQIFFYNNDFVLKQFYTHNENKNVITQISNHIVRK